MIELTRDGRYRVEVEFECRLYYIGCFDTAAEATAEYDKVAETVQSEFARFNFPDCTRVL